MLDYRADDVKSIKVIKYIGTTNINIKHSTELTDIIAFDNKDVPDLINKLTESTK